MQIIKILARKFLFVPSTIFVLFTALIPALAESVTDRSTPPITPGHTQLLNNYWDTYVKGQYWAFNSTWGVPSNSTINVDYTMSILVDTMNFPNNTIINWDLSKISAANVGHGVFAWPSIILGTIPGQPGSVFGGEAEIKVTGVWPMQFNAIKNLIMKFDFTLTGPKNNSNVMMELYSRNVANPTGPGADTYEIEFLLSPDQATRGYSSGRGSIAVNVPGYTGWKVKKNPGKPPLISFLPPANITSGTIDCGALLKFIVAQGWLSGTDWFSGLQFGPEPRSSLNGGPPQPWTGQLKINHLSYVWN